MIEPCCDGGPDRGIGGALDGDGEDVAEPWGGRDVAGLVHGDDEVAPGMDPCEEGVGLGFLEFDGAAGVEVDGVEGLEGDGVVGEGFEALADGEAGDAGLEVRGPAVDLGEGGHAGVGLGRGAHDEVLPLNLGEALSEVFRADLPGLVEEPCVDREVAVGAGEAIEEKAFSGVGGQLDGHALGGAADLGLADLDDGVEARAVVEDLDHDGEPAAGARDGVMAGKDVELDLRHGRQRGEHGEGHEEPPWETGGRCVRDHGVATMEGSHAVRRGWQGNASVGVLRFKAQMQGVTG